MKKYRQGNQTNFFILTNNFIQVQIAKKLCFESGWQNDINFLLQRSSFAERKKERPEGFDLAFGIPMLSGASRFTKWLNFFIYICFISTIIFRKEKGNLVIGNLIYNGNRFIVNFFSSYFNEIFILDEGSSTLNIYNKRSIKKEERLFDKLMMTYSPRRPLNFYTNFNLKENNFDRVILIKSLFPNLNIAGNLDNNAVFFIGCPLLENNIISKSYYNSLLRSLRINNPNKRIIYMCHPKEKQIMNNPLIKTLNIELRSSKYRLEEYFFNTEIDFEILASTISTGYLYATNIFGTSMKYQTYKLNEAKMPSLYHVESANLIYEEMRRRIDEKYLSEFSV